MHSSTSYWRVGRLPKDSLGRDFVERIRAVHAGKRHLPADITLEIALHAAQDALTDREIPVLRGVASGKANKEIAWEITVTEDTIKAHMKTIFSKLDVAPGHLPLRSRYGGGIPADC